MPSITNLVTTADHHAKINEVKNKITNVTKLPEHSKYIPTPEFNKVTAANFVASNNDFVNFVKKIDFDDKLKSLNKIKHVLVENDSNELAEKAKVISAKGLKKNLMNKYGVLNCAKHFYSGILQNCLVFIPTKKYIKYFSGNTRIYS